MPTLSDHLNEELRLIRCTPEVAAGLLVKDPSEWLAGDGRIRRYGSWLDAKRALLPLRDEGDEPSITLLLGLGEWSAVVNDCLYDDCSPFDVLRVRLGSRGVIASAGTLARQWCVQDGDCTRMLLCQKDNRWEWTDDGVPAAYEETSAYTRRRISDRLTIEMVWQYLEAETGVSFPIDWASFEYASICGVGRDDPSKLIVTCEDTDACDEEAGRDSSAHAAEPARSGVVVPSQLLERIEEQGNGADFLAMVTLEEFFEGNDDLTSLGVNLGSGHPGMAVFLRVLSRLRDDAEVQAVMVAIQGPVSTVPELGDGWPYSEEVWVLTSAAPDALRDRLAELRPSDVYPIREQSAISPRWPSPEPGMRHLVVWWD